eukprot:Hpha_TRINITY_DN8537_c0_g1::TRINITY_DN8537_c0_g1_i1::g.146406::m.146406
MERPVSSPDVVLLSPASTAPLARSFAEGPVLWVGSQGGTPVESPLFDVDRTSSMPKKSMKAATGRVLLSLDSKKKLPGIVLSGEDQDSQHDTHTPTDAMSPAQTGSRALRDRMAEIPAGLRSLTPHPRLKWGRQLEAVKDPLRQLFLCTCAWPLPRSRRQIDETDLALGSPFLSRTGTYADFTDPDYAPTSAEIFQHHQSTGFRTPQLGRGESNTALFIYSCGVPGSNDMSPFVVSHCFLKTGCMGAVRMFAFLLPELPQPPQIPTAPQAQFSHRVPPPQFPKVWTDNEVHTVDVTAVSEQTPDKAQKENWREFLVDTPRPCNFFVMVALHEKCHSARGDKKPDIVRAIAGAKVQLSVVRKLRATNSAPHKAPVKIFGIASEWGDFTSFAVFWFEYRGHRYPTIEHFFQSMKFEGTEYEATVRGAVSGEEAKKMGREGNLRADWEQVKENIMLEGLRAKFKQNRVLLEKLVSTGNRPLLFSDPADSYWGTGLKADGSVGGNLYGRLLMQVRTEIEAQLQAEKEQRTRAGAALGTLSVDGCVLVGYDAHDWKTASREPLVLQPFFSDRERVITPLYLSALCSTPPWFEHAKRMVQRVQESQKKKGVGTAMLEVALEDLGPARHSRALHAAAKSGHVEMIRLLLDNGACATAVNAKRSIPLHAAASADNAEAISAFLKHRESVNLETQTDCNGMIPLAIAIEARCRRAMHALLTTHPRCIQNQLRCLRPKDGSYPIHIACARHDITAVKALLRAAKSVSEASTMRRVGSLSGRQDSEEQDRVVANIAEQVGFKNTANETPMHSALLAAKERVCSDHPRWDGRREQQLCTVIKLLLELGASPAGGGPPMPRETPIHLAAAIGSLNVLRELLYVAGVEEDSHRGAVVWRPETDDRTHVVMSLPSGEELQLPVGLDIWLLGPTERGSGTSEHPDQVRVRTRRGDSEDEEGYLDFDEVFVDSAVESSWSVLEEVDDFERTPLMVAAAYDRRDVIEFLLRAKLRANYLANVIIPQYHGNYLERIGTLGNPGEAARILGKELASVVTHAAEEGHFRMVQHLEDLFSQYAVKAGEVNWHKALLRASVSGNESLVAHIMQQDPSADLLIHGKDDEPKKESVNPLLLAAANGQYNVVKLFIDWVDQAVIDEKKDVREQAKWLTTKGFPSEGSPAVTPICAALQATKGDAQQTVKALLDCAEKIDLDITLAVDADDKEAWIALRQTPLLQKGEVVLVSKAIDRAGKCRIRLESGEWQNIHTDSGTVLARQAGTPLHFAVASGKLDLVELVANYYSDSMEHECEEVIEALDAQGFTPLILAVRHRNTRIVAFLLQIRSTGLPQANPRVRTPLEESALHILANWQAGDNTKANDILDALADALRTIDETADEEEVPVEEEVVDDGIPIR